MRYFIGVDIGTTSTKSVLYDIKGKVISYANIGYSLYRDELDMAEEDPDDIFNAVIKTISQVITTSEIDMESVACVSFSSAMHSLILMDENDKPLTRSITWADNRAAKSSQSLKDTLLGKDFYSRTGTPIAAMTPLSKIMWIKSERPNLFKQAKKFIDIKSYVFFKLFGKYRMDYSIASATGMFNIFELDWDKKILEFLGINNNQLPKLVKTTDYLKGIDTKYYQQLKLPANVPFILGASDGVLSNLGLNAINDGSMAVTIGTSGAIRQVVDRPIVDLQGKLFCYALTENKWVIGGAVNNGGTVFKWIRENLFAGNEEDISYDEISKIVSEIPAGSDGLLFHPYLDGERAPIWNEFARGSYFGLSHHHTRAHMARAALEGTVYNLYSVMLMIESITGVPTEIQATGGFTRSEVWKQILADIFETQIDVPQNYESSCLGAAVMGMYSLGYIQDLSEVSKMVGDSSTYQPNEENFKIYRGTFSIWSRLSKVFESEYRQLEKLI